MPLLSARVTRDSANSCVLQLTGLVDDEHTEETVLNLQSLKEPQGVTHLRLVKAVHAIQSGLAVMLYWENDKDDHNFLLCLEGRGTLDFEGMGGIADPQDEGSTGGLVLRTDGALSTPRHFTLVLEFDKQRKRG